MSTFTRVEAMNKEWFAGWFDSPYYHLLYGHRDDREARLFIELLVQHHLTDKQIIVDLGCGKGRHSRVLAEHGKRVYGIDLSPESIDFASQQETAMASFSVQDMRNFSLDIQADAILNLFTSFGYFESVDEHVHVLSSVAENLRPGGLFVLDYFNAHLVEEGSGQFVPTQRTDIRFEWTKRKEDGCVYKDIVVYDGEHRYKFQERVRLFEPTVLNHMLQSCGLNPEACFGDYQLNEFNPSTSPRCIIFATRS